MRHPLATVAVIAALGVVHVAVVAGRYHVGSFDDDSAYLYMARGIANGTGLFGYLPNGFALVNAYPPGYSYLLAPLMLIFGGGGGFWAERALSIVCYTALFPLTWSFLRRRQIDEVICLVVLVLLALNPVLATYGSMVMAETPFLVVFLGLVFAAERWSRSPSAVTRAGLATVVLAAGSVWLKEAGVGMVAGLVLWLAWSRNWRKAFAAAAGCGVLLLPIAVARLVTGVPLAGARYTTQITGYLGGGIFHELIVLPMGALEFVFYALFAAVTPTDSPLSNNFAALVVLGGLASASAAVFCVVGAVRWWRRRSNDPVLFLIAAYFLECIAYKYVNERRVLLFLPVAIAWYVLGARATGRWVLQRSGRRGRTDPRAWRRRFAAAGFVGVLALAVQFPIDYRVRLGRGTSHPGGSPYMALLARLGQPHDVVATDFVWTTALYTGHPGATAAFKATYTHCSPSAALAGLRQDHAAFGLTAEFNAKFVDDACLAKLASSQPWAVTLMRTPWDEATVFEVIGPGTGHPDLQKLAWSASRSATAASGVATMEWRLPAGSSVTQVSLDGARGAGGRTGGVTVRLHTPGGWRSVAASPGAVGAGGVPFLLAKVPQGVRADAVSVTVRGAGTARVTDLAVLGHSPS